MRYNRISADSHIDLCWLPPDLFTSNARAELKERVPRVVDGPDGPYWTSNKGLMRPRLRRRSFGSEARSGPEPSRRQNGRSRALRRREAASAASSIRICA